MWFGLLRVVHLAAFFPYFSDLVKKRKSSLTETTEEPLDSGKEYTFTPCSGLPINRRLFCVFNLKNAVD